MSLLNIYLIDCHHSHTLTFTFYYFSFTQMSSAKTALSRLCSLNSQAKATAKPVPVQWWSVGRKPASPVRCYQPLRPATNYFLLPLPLCLPHKQFSSNGSKVILTHMLTFFHSFSLHFTSFYSFHELRVLIKATQRCLMLEIQSFNCQLLIQEKVKQ